MILSTINQKKKIKEQLHGLSEGAIKNWIDRNGHKNNEELIKLVFKTAKLTHALADVSNEVFNSPEIESSNEILSLNNRIRRIIQYFK